MDFEYFLDSLFELLASFSIRGSYDLRFEGRACFMILLEQNRDFINRLLKRASFAFVIIFTISFVYLNDWFNPQQ